MVVVVPYVIISVVVVVDVLVISAMKCVQGIQLVDIVKSMCVSDTTIGSIQ